MERCSFSCTSLSNGERAVIEIESCERPPAVRDNAVFVPVQPPGNHQMQDQPEIIVKPDGDSFPDAAQAGDAMVEDCFQRWVGGAQQRRPRGMDLLKDVAENPAFQRLNINNNVRQLGHFAWVPSQLAYDSRPSSSF